MPTIVDNIRKALEKRDGLSAEVMSPLAEAYSDDVNRVNERLGEAVGLLRKGLRSEAIQRASLNPNAIDGAANLDFPEVEEWLEILQFLDVPVPPLVDQDAAQQLNEAIVETQPLNELLNRHRRLAIAKAPLAWRLKVLRRIAQVDPMNAVWEEDLEAWEDYRLKQIPDQLERAISAGDAKTVRALRDELTTQSWRIEPGKRLIEEIQEAGNQFDDEANLQRLREIAPQIHEAFGQFDESLARSLRDQWQKHQAEMHSPVAMDLQDQIAPAFAWLDELDRDAATARQRLEAIGKLELALDKTQSIPDLHRVYRQASRFEEPIPIDLEQRYRVTVAEHELKGRRKSQAIFTSIIAATLLIATWIGYRQWNAREQQRIQSATAQMQALLSDGKLTEASQFWEQIKVTQPKIAATSDMASLSSQLKGQIDQEQARAEQFEAYLVKARHEDPSKIDTESLAKAESLAAAEHEKAAVFEIQRLRDQWERELQASQTQSVLDQLEQFRQHLDQIESGTASPESIKAVTILIEKIESLAKLFPRRSSRTDAQIQLERNRAVAIRDAMRKQSQQMQSQKVAMGRLLESSSLPAFADNLNAFVNAVPDSRMAKEFTKSAEERALWEQALEANQLMKLMRTSVIGGVSPQEATKMLDSIQGLADNVVLNPVLDPLPGLVESLTKIQTREAVLDKVFDDLSLQTVAELVTIEVPSPDDPSVMVRYFTFYSHFDQFRDRFNEHGQVGIEVVVNESAAVGQKGFVGPVKVIPEPRATVRWLMEQKDDHRARFLSDWDGTFMATAAQIRSRPNLDGLVKEILLLHLLEGCAQGSDLMAQQLRDPIVLLQRRKEMRRRWYVAAPLASDLSPIVEQLVVPELSRAYANRNNQWKKILAASQREYQWVGFLLRDNSGRITTYFNQRPEKDGDLFVVRPAVSDPNKVDFADVGKWARDDAALGRNHTELVAGRPLFFLPALAGR